MELKEETPIIESTDSGEIEVEVVKLDKAENMYIVIYSETEDDKLNIARFMIFTDSTLESVCMSNITFKPDTNLFIAELEECLDKAPLHIKYAIVSKCRKLFPTFNE